MAEQRQSKAKKGTKAAKAAAALAVRESAGGLARRPKGTTLLSERLAAEIVPEANSRIRAIGSSHDELASWFFKQVFGKNAAAALVPRKELGANFRSLEVRAGKSLKLDNEDLLDHLRIGAITKLRGEGDDLWPAVQWGEKRALLPLLDLPDDRKAFNEGIQYALQPNVGEDAVRRWVQERTPREEGSRGRPRGAVVTLRKSETFAETGLQLGDATQRARLKKELQALPREKRRAFVRGLRKASTNLAKLLQELEDVEG